MIKKFRKFLCGLGIHKKEKKVRTGEVNWILLTVEISCCKHCNKFYKLD